MVSSRLLELRLAKGMKQKEVSDAIGVSERAYCTYETGTRDPSTDTVVKLANLFDVSTDYLLGVSNTPSRSSNEPNLQGLLAKIFFEISDETRTEFVGLLQSYIQQNNIVVQNPTSDDRAKAEILEKKYFKYKSDDDSKSKV